MNPFPSERARALVVDATDCAALVQTLSDAGLDVEVARDAGAALRALSTTTFALAFIEQMLSDRSGLELATEIQAASPASQVVLMASVPSVEGATAALRQGLTDYLSKPVDLKAVRAHAVAVVEHGPLHIPNRLLGPEHQRTYRFEGLLGRSTEMHRLFDQIRCLSQSDSCVLITGESGTGKELAAQALHLRSARRHKRLVAVRCGGLSAEQFTAALYGVPPSTEAEQAESPQVAALERAHGGTLLLDDVTALDKTAQGELLRVLAEYTSTDPLHKRCRRQRLRILATTSANIERLVQQGHFRQDLYYRLTGAHIRLPSLRQRREDIDVLASEFLAELAPKFHRGTVILSPKALPLLSHYDWPGNVRELGNLLEQAVLHSRDRVLTPKDIDNLLGQEQRPAVITIPMGATLAQAEREVVLQTLAAQHGNKVATAQALDISRRGLYTRLQQYQNDSFPEVRDTDG